MDVLLFGIAREIVGERKLTVPADEDIPDVGSLKQWFAGRYPALRRLTSIAVAVNSEYAEDSHLLRKDFEIALIPPVSGG